jgi:signal transduction histidine kinase/CheY-like chemotaxis protein
VPATKTSLPTPEAASLQPHLTNDGTIIVLLVEDSASDARLIEESLRRARGRATGEHVELRRVERLADALEQIASEPPDVVLLDLSLPDSRGLETFRRVRDEAPAVPVVVLSGLADEDLAARAVRDGAQDYLVKGQADGRALVRSLRYAIARRRAETERAARFRERWARAEAEAAQSRLALLAAASRAFAEAGLEFERAAETVARSVAELLGDGCGILLRTTDATLDATGITPGDHFLQVVALHHTDPSAYQLARQLLADAPVRADQDAAHQVLENGQPSLLQHITVERLRQTTRPEHWPYLARFAVHTLAVVPLRLQGHVGGILVMWRDISPGAFSEDDLAFLQDLADRAALALENARLYRQVQEALQTRDTFLSSVAHDLKAPLTTIKVQAQLLNRQIGRILPRESDALVTSALRTRVSEIDGTVDKMTRMLDELVDLTRLQIGQPLVLQRKPVDIVDLARQVIQAHQQDAEQHTIRFSAARDSLIGQWDEVRLERVFNNLVGNAVKYSPEGGTVIVEISEGSLGDQPCAVLEVSDQGLGIPVADLPHIFERFRRAGNVADRIRGTGIGLSSSRQIVEQHGGSISVDSREGEGSTFTVRLPLSPPGSGEQPPVSVSSAAE